MTLVFGMLSILGAILAATAILYDRLQSMQAAQHIQRERDTKMQIRLAHGVLKEIKMANGQDEVAAQYNAAEQLYTDHLNDYRIDAFATEYAEALMNEYWKVVERNDSE